MLDDLLERFRRGDRLALSRLLSLVARGQDVDVIRGQLPRAAKPSRVVAITGSAGVGKSTLIGRLIEYVRRQGLTVAVLACDPQSPLSGGALLGDRFRMPSRPEDDGVFIRSLAAASGRGAVAERLGDMIPLLEAFGFDVILIETVGAGQGDTGVHDLADVLVLLVQPETGDDLQWEKAGLLEVADVIVIHKGDLPGAERVEAQVRAMLGLAHEHAAVLRVSAKKDEGIDQLWQAIAACSQRRQTSHARGRELLRSIQEALASRFARLEAAKDMRLQSLLTEWESGQVAQPTAVARLVELLTKDQEH